MSRRDDLTRLRHMRDHAVEAIPFTADRSLAELRSDRMLQLCFARLVEIVGEAAARVTPEGQDLIPHLPWPDIVGMRHRIVHGYDRLNLEMLWRTILEDLPPRVAALNEAIARLAADHR